ncbi:MAG: hypothetical protein SH856_12970 [Flavobacteriales bacterium]|nr:hypothetical protein [Flavobacteriales bacterium]
MKHTKLLPAALAMFFASTFHAQYLEVEIDSVHTGIHTASCGDVDLTGYVTFSVWAVVPDSLSCLVAILGGNTDAVDDLGCGNPLDYDNLQITFDGNVYNDPIGGITSASQFCPLFVTYPASQWDSDITIGGECAGDGAEVFIIGLPCDDTDFGVFAAANCTDNFNTLDVFIDYGGWFTLAGGFNLNSIAGTDHRVKIPQFTTNDGFCMNGWMSWQVLCEPGNVIESVWFDICQPMPCDDFGSDIIANIFPEEGGETFSIEI